MWERTSEAKTIREEWTFSYIRNEVPPVRSNKVLTEKASREKQGAAYVRMTNGVILIQRTGRKIGGGQLIFACPTAAYRTPRGGPAIASPKYGTIVVATPL